MALFGVRSEFLLTGEGLMGANTWSVRNRALYEVDGAVAHWDHPTLGNLLARAMHSRYRLQALIRDSAAVHGRTRGACLTVDGTR